MMIFDEKSVVYICTECLRRVIVTEEQPSEECSHCNQDEGPNIEHRVIEDCILDAGSMINKRGENK